MEIFKQGAREQILKKVLPNNHQRAKHKKHITSFISLLEDCAKELNINVSIVLGGSYAKGTYIVTDFDIDIFFQFESSIPDSKKEHYVQEILKQSKTPFRIERGSRKYVSGRFKYKEMDTPISFECVPTSKLSIEQINVQQIENSTDLSIYHVQFVNTKQKELLQEGINIEEEIILAKLWFKAQKLYGAESYINGFSGHSIECLIIHFKTLENVLLFLSQANGTQEHSEIVSLGVNWNVELISKDKYSPILIQDPIVVGRNALSALSYEMFYKAKFASQLALEHKISVNDCVIKKQSLVEQKKLFFKHIAHTYYISFEFEFKTEDKISQESDDIIGSKAKKIVSNVAKTLKNYDFTILNLEFEYIKEHHSALGIIKLKEKELSPFKYTKGPKLNLSLDVISNFITMHTLNTIELHNDTLVVKKKREIRSISQFVNTYLLTTSRIKKNFIAKEFKALSKCKITHQ